MKDALGAAIKTLSGERVREEAQAGVEKVR